MKRSFKTIAGFGRGYRGTGPEWFLKLANYQIPRWNAVPVTAISIPSDTKINQCLKMI